MSGSNDRPVPVVNRRDPRATRRDLRSPTQRRAREVPVDPRGRAGRGEQRSFPRRLCLLRRRVDRRVGGVSIDFGRLDLAHRGPIQVKAVSVVDDAVEDGIGEGGLGNNFVPLVDREL